MSMLPYAYDFERPLRLMERELFGPQNFHRMAPFSQLMPRNVFLPYNQHQRNIMEPQFYRPWDMFRQIENMMKPIEQLTSVMNQMALQEKGSKITADDEKFQVNIDVQHFSPEEINVKVVDGHVVVEGKHEEKEDEHGYISRQFIRRYALPQGCLPDTVESKLSSDGILTVTAPKVLALPSTGEKIVPLTQTGPVMKQVRSPEAVSADVQ